MSPRSRSNNVWSAPDQSFVLRRCQKLGSNLAPQRHELLAQRRKLAKKQVSPRDTSCPATLPLAHCPTQQHPSCFSQLLSGHSQDSLAARVAKAVFLPADMRLFVLALLLGVVAASPMLIVRKKVSAASVFLPLKMSVCAATAKAAAGHDLAMEGRMSVFAVCRANEKKKILGELLLSLSDWAWNPSPEPRARLMVVRSR